MIKYCLALAFALTPFAARAGQPPLPKLNLAQETALRCSAAFGLIAFDQQRGAPGADKYPPFGVRGKEFFVRTTARLMDETGASEAQVKALWKARVDELQIASMKAKDPGALVSGIINACLPLLEAEVPPQPTP